MDGSIKTNILGIARPLNWMARLTAPIIRAAYGQFAGLPKIVEHSLRMGTTPDRLVNFALVNTNNIKSNGQSRVYQRSQIINHYSFIATHLVFPPFLASWHEQHHRTPVTSEPDEVVRRRRFERCW